MYIASGHQEWLLEYMILQIDYLHTINVIKLMLSMFAGLSTRDTLSRFSAFPVKRTKFPMLPTFTDQGCEVSEQPSYRRP